MFNKNNKVNFVKKIRNKFTSIIIPVFKDLDGLKSTIESLKSQSYSNKHFEIIIANDENNDQIANFCISKKLRCVSIKNKGGSYNARNLALKVSVGEYLAFIDAGTVADRDWLKNGVRNLNDYDYIGGPVVTNEKLSNTHSKILYLYQKIYSFPVNSFMKDLKFVPTTNLFVKRKVVEEVGGFDFRLISSGDYEFGNRVYSSKKFKQIYNSKVKVFHPVRTLSSLIAKQKRLARGFSDLVQYYPERFSNLSTHPVFSLVKLLFPPIWNKENKMLAKISTKEAINVFLLMYYLSFLQHFYRIYYWVFVRSN